LGQRSIPPLIAQRLVTPIMRLSVNLDRQATVETCEIEYIAADQKLAPESKTAGPQPQLLPQ
jgi:hypothetical protein